MRYQAIEFSPEEVIDYLRKSQSDDPLLTVEEVLAKHEEILDRWSEKHLGGKVPEDNKFREVVSGETLDDRPEINKVLRLIESPKYKAVKVVDPQRLTRGDLEDIGRLMKLLKLTNTLVIVPDEWGERERVYDLRDEDDWDAFERELKKGNDYLKYTKKILNRGRLLSVSNGNYIGNTPPYGYNKTFIMEGKRKCPILVPNEEEAEVVRMMFDLYVNKDMGCRNICKKFDELGIKPPRGEFWSASAMAKMLENIHYIGKVKWNQRKTLTIVEDGEFKKTRPVAKAGEYLIYEGKHEAIISDELFYAAQEKKGRNVRVKTNAKIRNPLAGLVFCQCGRAMSYRTYYRDGVERAPARLLCDNQAHCKTSSCLYDEFLERLCAILQQSIDDFEVLIQNNNEDAAKFHTSLIKRLKARMEELNQKEISQWEKYAEEGMPKHIFDSLNEKVLKEKEEVQQALCKAYESMPDPTAYMEKQQKFKDALEALTDPDVPIARKNMLLKACIERIDYNRAKTERIKSQKKRVTIDGKRVYISPLHTGANWASSTIELDVKMKV